MGSVIELIRKPEDRDWLVHFSLTSKSAGRHIALSLLTLILLPYDALISLSAIMYSGFRMLFTRRSLMLWHLPSYARRNACHTLADFVKEMWIGPVLSVLLILLLESKQLSELLFCALILLVWFLSPIVGWWISKPLVSPLPQLTMDQRVFLRKSARRTWRYFAQFVGPKDNWLPPDNFQEYPTEIIATRTSPTNIGMALLADLAAYDFGYISAGEFLCRIQNTLDTMEKLERYLGHFYNWYDTRTLKPLHPQYVSSVDSGNLAGSLLTLQAGLIELKDQPILSTNTFQGLQDTLRVLAEHVPKLLASEMAKKIKDLEHNLNMLTLDESVQTLVIADSFLVELQRIGKEMIACLPTDIDIDGELYYWAQTFVLQISAFQEDLRYLVSEPQHLNNIPTLAELASAGTEPRVSTRSAQERIKTINALVDRCRQFAIMDFEFLYDLSLIHIFL